MTFKVFLQELRKLKGSFEMTRRGYLRSSAFTYCPISAVAFRLGEDDTNAFTTLRLGHAVRGRIISAADNGPDLTPAELKVRKQMLRALKLKESK